MAAYSLLSTIFKYSVKNPTIFKIAVFFRNHVPNTYLLFKSFLLRWKRYSKPQEVLESMRSYAEVNKFECKVIKEATVLHHPLPKTISEYIDNAFKHNVQITFPAQMITTIPFGRVVNQGFVITPDNSILEEVSMMFNGSKPVYKRIDNSHKLFTTDIATKPAEFIDARIAVLATPSAQHNYYHWMMELLPRLQTLRMGGFDLNNDIDYFFVNSTASSFQKETLKACGVSTNKIIDSIWHPHVTARELIVISRTGKDGFFDHHTVNFLRGLFKDSMKKTNSKMIYLNRHNVRHRRILNENELEQMLINYGFESISLDNLSVSEQASLLSSAKVVISGHGASLTNLVFCHKGTKVLELFQSNNIHPIYWGISNILDLEYHYLKSSEAINDSHDIESNFSDMVFDLNDVEKALKLMLKSTTTPNLYSM